MGNFFTKDWFPLNIIITLVLAAIAVVIWGLVTNWGKGQPVIHPCKTGQSRCGTGCIDDIKVCVNGKPCDSEKATQDNKKCCPWEANGNTCEDCKSPLSRCYKDGHVVDKCCLKENCSQNKGGCCENHICTYGCCASPCCKTGATKTECCDEQVGEYCHYSPGPSPYSKCKIKCGAEWCDPDKICETNPIKNTGHGLCDDGSDNPKICSESSPCTSSVSCNYGVCEGGPSSGKACTSNGCPDSAQACIMKRCERLSPCTWKSASLTFIPTPLYVNNKGELCNSEDKDCKSNNICNKVGAPGSLFFCKDAPGSYYRTAKRTAREKSNCNAYDCLTSSQEQGMTKLDWSDNTCISKYDCNKDI